MRMILATNSARELYTYSFMPSLPSCHQSTKMIDFLYIPTRFNFCCFLSANNILIFLWLFVFVWNINPLYTFTYFMIKRKAWFLTTVVYVLLVFAVIYVVMLMCHVDRTRRKSTPSRRVCASRSRNALGNSFRQCERANNKCNKCSTLWYTNKKDPEIWIHLSSSSKFQPMQATMIWSVLWPVRRRTLGPEADSLHRRLLRVAESSLAPQTPSNSSSNRCNSSNRRPNKQLVDFSILKCHVQCPYKFHVPGSYNSVWVRVHSHPKLHNHHTTSFRCRQLS